MLTGLSIRDVVLIDTLDLEFGPGLGVLTGETGAGKSILLDALGLALGMRADSGLVRAGQAQAVVSVAFELPARSCRPAPCSPKTAWTASPASRSSSAASPRPTAAAAPSSTIRRSRPGCCASSARLLVEIHGQHDDRGLLNPRGHRALLDAYGRIDGSEAAAAWAAVRALEDRLAEARAATESAERDREWLEHAVDELTQLAPEPGEEENLAGLRADDAGGRAPRRRAGDDRGAAAGLGGRPRPAPPGGAAARPDRGRASRARRGAGRARPGGDRGLGRRGCARPRRRGADLRSAAAGGGRGAAVRDPRSGAQAPGRGRCAARPAGRAPGEARRDRRRRRPDRSARRRAGRSLRRL